MTTPTTSRLTWNGDLCTSHEWVEHADVFLKDRVAVLSRSCKLCGTLDDVWVEDNDGHVKSGNPSHHRAQAQTA